MDPNSGEAAAAEKIVAAEVHNFLRWARSQQVVPVIKALRTRALAIADAEVERTIGSLGAADPKSAQRVRAMSQAIVNKLLHPALARLKHEGAEGDPGPLVEALESLFELELGEAPEDEDESNVVPIDRERGQGS